MISATELNNKDGSADTERMVNRKARAHQVKMINEEDDKDVKEHMVTAFPDGTVGEIVTEEEDDEIVKRVVVADETGEQKQMTKAHAKIGRAPHEKPSKDSKDVKDESEKIPTGADKEPKVGEKAAEGAEKMDAEEEAFVKEEAQQKTFYKKIASLFGSFTNSLFNIY